MSDTTQNVTLSGIRYYILGDNFQMLVLHMPAGTEVLAEQGAMVWMNEKIDFSAALKGGIGGAIARKLTGENAIFSRFRATQDFGEVAFAGSVPAKIIPYHLMPGQGIVAQKGSVFVHEPSVNISIALQRIGVGLFGGEGFIMQHISGPGSVFLYIDGEVVERYIQPGESLRVDPIHIAAVENTVQIDIEMVKSIRAVFGGGEGLFLAKLYGNGRVWLQSTPRIKFAIEMALGGKE